MTNRSILKYLLQISVVLTGIYLSWNLNVFIPLNSQYPPRNSYQKLAGSPKADTVLASPGKHYSRNYIGEFFLGKHYRSVWAEPVKVPVLSFGKKNGGLKVVKKGGGMQTTRFTLTDSYGNEYSLRSVDKDPVHVLPAFFRNSFVASFVRDQISATDPYAAQVVDVLAKQGGIPHNTSVRYFILPEDTVFHAFGVKNGGFYNLSPKDPDVKEIQKPGEEFGDYFSTEEMLELLSEHKGEAVADSLLFLRCRLFDLLIGDWDRHERQWDWAGFYQDKHTVFRPLPKDRDQAFGYYKDGILPFLLSRRFTIRKISSFTPEVEDVVGFTMNGRVLDNILLVNIPVEQFESEAKYLQNKLTDEVIRRAVNQYPAEVAPIMADRVINTLISRRQNLIAGARQFYQIVRERNEQKQ